MPLTIAPSTAHTHTIIFLHARGSTPSELSDSLTRETPDSAGRSLVEALPSVRWVFPAPPTASASASNPPPRAPAPRTAPAAAAAAAAANGTEWFPPRPRAQQVSALWSSVRSVRRLVADEAARLHDRRDRVILIGFSQGAVVASHLLLHMDRPLAALLCISGRMLFPEPSLAETRRVLRDPPVNGHHDHHDSDDDDDEDSDAYSDAGSDFEIKKPLVNGDVHDEPDDDDVEDAVRQTPVLVQHSESDLVSPVENGKALRDALCRFGAEVTWEEIPGGGHWLNTPGGVDGVIKFLVEIVGVAEAEREGRE